MQLREDTRLSVARRIEGVGKEIMLSWTGGGGVLNCVWVILVAQRTGRGLEDEDWTGWSRGDVIDGLRFGELRRHADWDLLGDGGASRSLWLKAMT